MDKTPRSNRIHIGIFGLRNAGKSSLLNYLTDQESSLVSSIPGTTTDPVYKSMEIHELGPVVFIDTAGFDDDQDILGKLRVEKTHKAIDKSDVGIFIFSSDLDKAKEEADFYQKLLDKNINVINIFPQTGKENLLYKRQICSYLGINEKDFDHSTVYLGMKNINDEKSSSTKEKIIGLIKDKYQSEQRDITGKLVGEGSLVIMVMPQDDQAPKGRIILPQVQTLRELLDKRALTLCLSHENLEDGLKSLSREPDLIITDSQVFEQVYKIKGENTKLTSFSVLFAALKGDIDYFVSSTSAFERLNKDSRVLICEACTHPPLDEDIGRVKIPNMLRKKYGNLNIDFVRGDNFPKDPSSYDLIIHCGACMFNKKHVVNRVLKAKSFGVPMTNYGITIAYMKGILKKIVLP